MCRLVACGEVVAAVAMLFSSSSKGGSVSRAGGEMGGELVEGRGNVFHVCDVRRFVDIEVIVVVVLLGRTTKSFRPSLDPCTRHSSLSRVVVLHSRRERVHTCVCLLF